LLAKWNDRNPNNKRELDNFWKSTNLNEFMEEVVKDPQNNLKFNTVEFTDLKLALTSISKGRYGGTWMHPYLYLVLNSRYF
jgi:hypothetical protein